MTERWHARCPNPRCGRQIELGEIDPGNPPRCHRCDEPYMLTSLATMARLTDPASSHQAAAEHVASGANASQKDRVWAAIDRYPGVTAERLAEVTGLEPYVVRKRTADLRNAGRAYSQAHGTECLRWYPVTP